MSTSSTGCSKEHNCHSARLQQALRVGSTCCVGGSAPHHGSAPALHRATGWLAESYIITSTKEAEVFISMKLIYRHSLGSLVARCMPQASPPAATPACPAHASRGVSGGDALPHRGLHRAQGAQHVAHLLHLDHWQRGPGEQGVGAGEEEDVVEHAAVCMKLDLEPLLACQLVPRQRAQPQREAAACGGARGGGGCGREGAAGGITGEAVGRRRHHRNCTVDDCASPRSALSPLSPSPNWAVPSLLYTTCAGSTLQGTTVWVAEHSVAPTLAGGVVVLFQPVVQGAEQGGRRESESGEVGGKSGGFGLLGGHQAASGSTTGGSRRTTGGSRRTTGGSRSSAPSCRCSQALRAATAAS